jgi:CHAT domain-containing protein
VGGDAHALTDDQLRTAVARLADGAFGARRKRARSLPRTEAVADLVAEDVLRLLRVDLDRAERMAEALSWIAGDIGGRALGTAARALGHVAFQRGRNDEALRHYARAARTFTHLGLDLELARVRMSAFNAASRTGRHATALVWAEQARAIFAAHDDPLRMARLDANVATLLFRRDRIDEALRMGRRALRTFDRIGAVEDLAITQLNTAVRLTAMHDFPRALRMFARTRAWCVRHGLHLLLLEVEGNLAYLHAQRGEYARALALYGSVRSRAVTAGQDYLVTWLLLDEAELLVELNADRQAVPLANEALDRCVAGDMRQDAAKARTQLAVCAARRGDTTRALALFESARQAFAEEGNQARVALTDLYRALVLARAGAFDDAAARAADARVTLQASGLGAKVALASLVLARVALAGGIEAGARRHLADARAQLRRYRSPALAYQAAFLLGEVEHAAGHAAAAARAYARSHRLLEGLRSDLRVEELKIAFLDDKAVVYQSMVRVALQSARRRRAVARGFAFVQQAKSRALADLLARGALDGEANAGADHPTGLRAMRAELNACYREIDRLEQGAEAPPPRRLTQWRARAADGEERLARALFEQRRRNPGAADLHGGGAARLAEVQASLGDATLVEYVDVRGQLHAWVVDRRRATVVPLARMDAVRHQVQLALFNLLGLPGPWRASGQTRQLEPSTHAHLRRLRAMVLDPLASRLRPGRPLVVAAFGPLHRVPFHALPGDEGVLGDEHPVMLTPSGSVFALGRLRPAAHGTGALVLGVADRKAPRIAAEARAVAACLDDATLRLGARATEAVLRRVGALSRVIHVATHGLYRDEHPMFSAIRLARTRVDVLDLYGLRLSADLVTLSGCSTGVSFVAGGDELLGLSRGLLHAGAACVHLSLWDVDDESTTLYMTAFYEQYVAGRSPAEAAQRAAALTRTRYPHPYFWAPFVVVGQAAPRDTP